MINDSSIYTSTITEQWCMILHTRPPTQQQKNPNLLTHKNVRTAKLRHPSDGFMMQMIPIIGGSCHKYFCHDKSVLAMAKRLSRQHAFVLLS